MTLDVEGMKCAGCVRAVENQLAQQAGVISATVNLVTEVAMVECEPNVDPAVLAGKLTAAGFPAQPRYPQNALTGAVHSAMPETGQASRLENKQQQQIQQQWRQATIAAVLLVCSAIGHLDHVGWAIPGLSNIWFHCGLATLALLAPGRSMLIDGWRGLRYRTPNMNTLVGMGVLSAYTASLVALLFPRLGWECFFDEPVMLVGFILLGRALEQQARVRATAALQSLIALQPTQARLIDRDQCDAAHPASLVLHASGEIPVDRVQVGEWLQVLPGDKVPVDGEVVAGQTAVNESMLTGEAVPVLKQPGDFVAAGSLNQTGTIALKATRTGQDTTLAQIIALVEAAQTRKAPIQRLADTIAGYFTYGVMAIAALTFLFWYFIGIPLNPGLLGSFVSTGEHLMHAAMAEDLPHIATTPLLLSLKLSIAVLVIACPCALGLATPTAILVGSGIGAERGLLIRGGDVLEKVHQLTTVVFDKTGTLTTGQPTVTDCLSYQDSIAPFSVLQLAATVESGTRHPLAEAIRRQAQQQNLPLLPAQDFYTEAGMGVSALVAGQQVLLGTHRWLCQQGIDISDSAQGQAQAWATAGKTVVYVAVDGTLVGLIAVEDALRPDACCTLQQLQQMGLRVMMFTGDQPAAAAAIVPDLGLAAEDVVANLHPQEKAAAIAQLQQQGQHVAMVGDGINDAPALAQADVSIALHGGTEVAMETAEIILMRDRLSDILESIRLSQATFNKIRQNLFWAFAYNTLGIPIAAGLLLPAFGIVLSPATAGAFMAFSSMSVVTNSLMLRRQFPMQAASEPINADAPP
jgi:Cu2+-exporting ATPase